MYTKKTDIELIELYRNQKDEHAMRALVERHYDTVFRRFSRELRNQFDAEDASQKLWLQVARNLDGYEDQGKFSHYLSSIASNIIKTHWRDTSTRQNVVVEATQDEEGNELEAEDWVSPENLIADHEMVRYLTEELIPSLPAEQRLAWLLRHESEYWEPNKPMKWQQMAELNGVNVDQMWHTFENAREKLMHKAATDSVAEIGTEELSAFLVWTQAQRANKNQKFSWDYFAHLLNVPVNTMKTRYRSAQQTLANGLAEYGSVQA